MIKWTVVLLLLNMLALEIIEKRKIGRKNWEIVVYASLGLLWVTTLIWFG